MAEASAAPVTAAYYYRVRWGFQDEFVELFERNHWPLLREQMKQGRILDVRSYVPRFHGDGRADWTFLVTITWRDWTAIQEHTSRELVQGLFPDQEKYAAEERRRFEILDAHWDVPLEERILPL